MMYGDEQKGHLLCKTCEGQSPITSTQPVSVSVSVFSSLCNLKYIIQYMVTIPLVKTGQIMYCKHLWKQIVEPKVKENKKKTLIIRVVNTGLVILSNPWPVCKHFR